MNSHSENGKKNRGSFSCCPLETSPTALLLCAFVWKARQREVVFHAWTTENVKITHICTKNVARKQPRLFERGKVTACFYENTHLPVSAYQFGLSRVVRFQRHCFFPFFQLLPSIFTGIAREKRKKLKHILWKWNFQKESCRSFLKILNSISSSILIPAGPIALLQAFLVWY